MHSVNNITSIIKIVFTLLLFFLFINNSYSQALITHTPLGYENIYNSRELEIPVNKIEREPRDPIDGENVFVNFKSAPIYNKQECFVNTVVNGKIEKTNKAEFQYNFSGESYWRTDIEKFVKNDSVEYRIVLNYGDNEKAFSEKYHFVTYGWDWITDVKSVKLLENGLLLLCNSTDPKINPLIQIVFHSESILKVSIFFKENQKEDNDLSQKCDIQTFDNKSVLKNDKLILEINYKPLHLKLINRKDNNEIVSQYIYNDHGSIKFLNNKNGILKSAENYSTTNEEMFFGLGERYNSINQRGNKIDNYVVNIWKDQGLKSYIPIPFYFTNKNYGFFLNTTYYSQFDFDSEKSNRCEIVSNIGRNYEGKFEYYLFANNESAKIISDFTKLTGKIEEIPVWTLGPWISANEWDNQMEIEAQIDSLKKYDIPNTVVVIEAWSDEETFYIFNDAEYKLKNASESYLLKDFKFGGRWPDPVGMINDLHKDNMKIVLWNIPVLKSSTVASKQRDNDEKYAIDNNYVVKNSDGTPYRIPPSWFGNSLNLDFTNKVASDWWMEKRRYLIEEMKVDGFKCDGGEFIWGRDLEFSDGRKGDEMRNLYPNLYVDAYYKFIKSIDKDAIVFHRAGTTGAQQHPLAWNGDQSSSFPAFKEAIRSCINSSISGISFIAYDIAGYHDETNLTSELYKRSLAQAAFSPVMQLHSGYSGDAHLERTPWNIAQLLNDKSCIDVYKKFANIRFNLIPYLYTETKYTSETAMPLMRPLMLDYPSDKKVYKYETDYLLGRNLLVFPVTEPGKIKEIYFPKGDWFDFWSFKKHKGETLQEMEIADDNLPVYIKDGTITPLNLDKDFNLALNMTNNLSVYNNLTFVIFPSKNIEYEYNDYIEGDTKKIKSILVIKELRIEIPSFKTDVSMIIHTSPVKEVRLSGTMIKASNNWEEFISSKRGYYYNVENEMLFLKQSNSNKKQIIEITTK